MDMMALVTRTGIGASLGEDGTVRIAQVDAVWSKVVLRRSAVYGGEGGDLAAKWSSALTKAHRDGYPLRRAVVGIPASITFRRTLSFPFRSRRKISEVLLSQLEGEIPAGIDGLVADYVPLPDRDGAPAGMAVAAPKETVAQALAACPSPLAVQIDALGLATAAVHGKVRDGAAVCCVPGGVIGVALASGQVTGLRCLPLPGSAIEDAARISELAAELVEKGDLLVACGPLLEPVLAALSEKEIRRVATAGEMAVFRDGPRPLEGDPGPFLPALGLALRALGRHQGAVFDLRRGPFRPMGSAVGLARPLARAAALAILAMLLWFGSLASGLVAARTEYQRYAEGLRAAFAEIFPDTRVVNEVAQIQERITQMERRAADLAGFGGAGALSVLSDMSRSIPDDADLRIDEFALESGRLRVEGSVPSFDAVDRVKTALEKLPTFASVQVQNARVGADAGRVTFRLQAEVL